MPTSIRIIEAAGTLLNPLMMASLLAHEKDFGGLRTGISMLGFFKMGKSRWT